MALSAGMALVGMTRGGVQLASPARAEAAGSIAFDIAPQSLEAALDAYGAASRIQVLYETSLAAGHWSQGVRGIYPPDDALRLLLAGTGLDFNYTTERAITLVPSRARDRRAQADLDMRRHIARFDHFLGGVQSGIMTALCRDSAARPGSFTVTMRFWITGAGTIANPALLVSSGTPSRDRAITNVLARLAFSELPPVDLPQPITMVLSADRVLRDKDRCADTDRN